MTITFEQRLKVYKSNKNSVFNRNKILNITIFSLKSVLVILLLFISFLDPDRRNISPSSYTSWAASLQSPYAYTMHQSYPPTLFIGFIPPSMLIDSTISTRLWSHCEIALLGQYTTFFSPQLHSLYFLPLFSSRFFM